jgi:hypothetical protein
MRRKRENLFGVARESFALRRLRSAAEKVTFGPIAASDFHYSG